MDGAPAPAIYSEDGLFFKTFENSEPPATPPSLRRRRDDRCENFRAENSVATLSKLRIDPHNRQRPQTETPSTPCLLNTAVALQDPWHDGVRAIAAGHQPDFANPRHQGAVRTQQYRPGPLSPPRRQPGRRNVLKQVEVPRALQQ